MAISNAPWGGNPWIGGRPLPGATIVVPSGGTNADIMRAQAQIKAKYTYGTIALEAGGTYTITDTVTIDTQRINLIGNNSTLQSVGFATEKPILLLTNLGTINDKFVGMSEVSGLKIIGKNNGGGSAQRDGNDVGIRLNGTTVGPDNFSVRCLLTNISITSCKKAFSIQSMAYFTRVRGFEFFRSKFGIYQEAGPTDFAENVCFEQGTVFNCDCLVRTDAGQLMRFYGVSFDYFGDSTGGRITQNDYAFYLASGATALLYGCHIEFAYGNQGAVCTASSSGTTLTASAIASGSLGVGYPINGPGIASGTYIVSQLTGSAGSTGTYQLSVSQTVASTTMYVGQSNAPILITGAGTRFKMFGGRIGNFTGTQDWFWRYLISTNNNSQNVSLIEVDFDRLGRASSNLDWDDSLVGGDPTVAALGTGSCASVEVQFLRPANVSSKDDIPNVPVNMGVMRNGVDDPYQEVRARVQVTGTAAVADSPVPDNGVSPRNAGTKMVKLTGVGSVIISFPVQDWQRRHGWQMFLSTTAVSAGTVQVNERVSTYNNTFNNSASSTVLDTRNAYAVGTAVTIPNAVSSWQRIGWKTIYADTGLNTRRTGAIFTVEIILGAGFTGALYLDDLSFGLM